MYVRELGLRDAEYRRAWWALTRAYLGEYDAADLTASPVAPGRLLARVILASPEPRDLPRLRRLRDDGAGVLMISEDLDELLALADRLVVLYAGRVIGDLARSEATVTELGLLMTGHERATSSAGAS